MKDSYFGPSKDGISDRRVDDVELESLLRRTAEFLASRGSQLGEQRPGVSNHLRLRGTILKHDEVVTDRKDGPRS